MRTYDERTAQVAGTIKKRIWRRRTITAVALGSCVAMLLLILFLPYSTTPPSLRQYKSSPYYSLMVKINDATYVPPKYDNLFGEVMGEMNGVLSDGLEEDALSSNTAETPESDPSEGYVETTDNQVQGVTEADIIKRSTEYVYYLRQGILSVYTVAEENSTEVATFEIEAYKTYKDETGAYGYATGAEMYLSQDCTTLTVVVAAYRSDKGANTILVTLDVTNPKSITQVNEVYVSGSYLSSRMVNEKLLVMSSFRIASDYDFDDESTFLPQIGTPGNMVSVDAEDILCPDTLSSTRYTVISKLDGKTLDVLDSAALLSYSDNIYVSQEHIFATRSFSEKVDTADGYETRTMTEISCINYAEDTLEHTGSVTVQGNVKNQYSMDEHAGTLRVVTSINNAICQGTDEYIELVTQERNVSLYCVSLTDFSVVASVEKFAPAGEQAESVRFDGNTAYVCTAEVILLTDPVYFFDLSDLSNITWKDTGTIDGYSSSLIQMQDGFLMGIGYGDSWQLKIEIYEATEEGVVSVCAYEENVIFSEAYKSYFIDRENNLVGLGVNHLGQRRYILLHFDGYQFNVLVDQAVSGSEDQMRAFMENGWLYIFSDGFDVVKVW